MLREYGFPKMTPSKLEFDIGSTVYKQPLRLVRQRDTGGTFVWTLHKDAGGQRDESDTITGLTRENILAMARAVESIK